MERAGGRPLLRTATPGISSSGATGMGLIPKGLVV